MYKLKTLKRFEHLRFKALSDQIFKKLKILKIKDMVDQGRENIMFAINKKVAPIA
jgi:hypothetical protein